MARSKLRLPDQEVYATTPDGEDLLKNIPIPPKKRILKTTDYILAIITMIVGFYVSVCVLILLTKAAFIW